jgi:protein-S-isoprenylcysteine O-methyltransferase Ste14
VTLNRLSLRVRGPGFLFSICGAVWWKAREEERMASRHFPDAYADYKMRVPAIFPFVL